MIITHFFIFLNIRKVMYGAVKRRYKPIKVSLYVKTCSYYLHITKGQKNIFLSESMLMLKFTHQGFKFLTVHNCHKKN